MSQRIRTVFYKKEILIFILELLLFTTSAQLDGSSLSVLWHDKCDDGDITCGSCCCNPLNSGILDEMTIDTTPVQALCLHDENLPGNLPRGTQTLKLLNSSFAEISKNALDPERLVNLTTLHVWKNRALKCIKNHSFSGFLSLRTITFENLPHLETVEKFAFENLPELRELRFKNTGLRIIPGFDGLSEYSILISPMKLIIEDSRIDRISTGSFETLPDRIKIVYVSWNSFLTTIEDYAFNGSAIAQLSLNDNKMLTKLHDRAFAGMRNLHMLSLRGTPISELPKDDLRHLVEIDLRRTPNLLRLSMREELPSLKVAELTYPYHCCSLNPYGFGSFFEQNAEEEQRDSFPCNDTEAGLSPVKSGFVFREREDNEINDTDPDPDYDQYIFPPMDYNHLNVSIPVNVHPNLDGSELVARSDETIDDDDGRSNGMWGKIFSSDGSWDDKDPEMSSSDDVSGSWGPPVQGIRPSTDLCYRDKNGNIVRDVYVAPIKCTPEPDAFNPCENVLGSNFLPVISWIVSALAIFGNFFVILVLSVVTFDKACSRHHNHLSVQKFLVLNLAIADMCMGLYLLIISGMDARSSGEYYKFGVEWQKGLGCKICGFLAIFSSQLSVYTLSVISLERWYAIRYAIQLDKRMKIGCARVCIFFGWVLAIVMATLPLVGINSYEKTSICLPFDISDNSGVVYVAVLLFIAIGAFFVDLICYIWMYASVRSVGIMEHRKRKGSVTSTKTGAYHGTTATADTVVAKRMAVLVFTNFACFFPISFFVLTAAAGHPLISISHSKILLVIFFPINSCCNPFLYAIMTKSFRRDLLAWFTSRGYCSNFAAKLNGAYWRRYSMEPGNSDKKEFKVRKTLQRILKHLTRRRSLPFDSDGSSSYRGDSKFSSSKRFSMRRESYNFCSSKTSGNNRNDHKSYRTYSDSEAREDGKSMTKLFRQALVSNNVPSSQSKSRLTKLMCFKSSTKDDTSRDSATVTSPEDAHSPLIDNVFIKQDSRANIDSRPTNYQYGRRSSRSRHSTTTIETRITVNGVNRDPEDICSTTV